MRALSVETDPSLAGMLWVAFGFQSRGSPSAVVLGGRESPGGVKSQAGPTPQRWGANAIGLGHSLGFWSKAPGVHLL